MKWMLFISIITILIVPASFLIYESVKMPGEFQVIQFNATREEILIGVISDTHIPSRADEIPVKVKETFQNVDLIIHAGDIESLEVIEELEKIAPVIAAHGNMDPVWVREKLPPAVCVEIYDWRIGVIHNSMVPWTGWKMERIAKENNLNILIFGHIHRPFLKENDILIINPGSPTNPLLAKPSVALLNISKDSYEGKIVYLD